MKVMKFGGSSLATSKQIGQVADLIKQQPTVAVVLSAPGQLTDVLAGWVTDLTTGTHGLPEKAIITALNDLNQAYPEAVSRWLERLKTKATHCQALGSCPQQVLTEFLVSGESLSVALMQAQLNNLGTETNTLCPAQFITVNEDGSVDVAVSKARYEQLPEKEGVTLMPGFFGADQAGQWQTLGRNGSDFSAALLSVCAGASDCEIWTDVDGVYQADPRWVAESALLPQLSYQEAMDMSYFGAKVIHPKTIAPLAECGIKAWIRNAKAPQKPGTLISHESVAERAVTAVTHLSDMAMINVTGQGLQGMVGAAAQVFDVMAKEQISVILISQTANEQGISFCVPDDESRQAVKALSQAFALSIQHGLVNPIERMSGLSIVTVVGDGMHHHKGVAKQFFKALTQARVNVKAIAQDASERSISAVINGQKTQQAVVSCHQHLCQPQQRLDVFVLGCGTVGQVLLSQMFKQQDRLLEQGIELKIHAVANSRQCLFNPKPDDWSAQLKSQAQVDVQAAVQSALSQPGVIHPVLVDCTASGSVAQAYPAYFEAGFDIVTSNKLANTLPWELHQKMLSSARKHGRLYRYETHVGAGLPVIKNLKALIQSGDDLMAFEGILSGSLSLIFGLLELGQRLSEAVKTAQEMGFTEPDVSQDLSGMDVARKVLIVAREVGLPLSMEDIDLMPVVSFEGGGSSVDAVIAEQDDRFKSSIKQAQEAGAVLRYVASIENGRCRVGIKQIPKTHPLADIKGGENALSLLTEYYQPMPFVIRGYGAGAAVTAAGLFGDVLSLSGGRS